MPTPLPDPSALPIPEYDGHEPDDGDGDFTILMSAPLPDPSRPIPEYDDNAPGDDELRPDLFRLPAPPPDRFHWDLPDLSAFPTLEYDDDDDDDDDDGPVPHVSGKGKSLLRAPGACDACKRSHARCIFPDQPGAKCRHCERSGQDCHVASRKPRGPVVPSHTELLDRIRQKDNDIVGLLHPSQSTTDDDPAAARVSALVRRLPPLDVWNKHIPKDYRERLVDAWIAQARLSLAVVDPALSPLPISLDDPIIQTDIIRVGLVSPPQVDLLFRIFFDKINMFFPICDPVLHTPAHVYRTSPFLFTTICAIASRHHDARPDLYPKLLHTAMKTASAALHIPRAIETCQAYLLLSVYHPPPRTFVEERSFLFLGLAIRLAIDLGLHLPQPQPTPDMPELSARAMLNRARLWLNCFCNDRSVSTLLGKPSAITFARAPPYDLRRWWASSPYSGPFDIYICAYATLLVVLGDFSESVVRPCEGDMQRVYFAEVLRYFDELDDVAVVWEKRLAENSARRPHPATTWHDNLWPFIVYYAKLVVSSFGLRAGMRQGLRADNPFGDLCIEVATRLLTHVTEQLASLGYLRYCVDEHFIFMGYAAAFLLKILRPRFAFLMHGRPGGAAEIVALVHRLVDLLGSDTVAIDGWHTPRLYARFLRRSMEREGLLSSKEKKRTGGAKEDMDGDVHMVDATPRQVHAAASTSTPTPTPSTSGAKEGRDEDVHMVDAASRQMHAAAFTSTPSTTTARLATPTTDIHAHAHLHAHSRPNVHAYVNSHVSPIATPPTTLLSGPSSSYANPSSTHLPRSLPSSPRPQVGYVVQAVPESNCADSNVTTRVLLATDAFEHVSTKWKKIVQMLQRGGIFEEDFCVMVGFLEDTVIPTEAIFLYCWHPMSLDDSQSLCEVFTPFPYIITQVPYHNHHAPGSVEDQFGNGAIQVSDDSSLGSSGNTGNGNQNGHMGNDEVTFAVQDHLPNGNGPDDHPSDENMPGIERTANITAALGGGGVPPGDSETAMRNGWFVSYVHCYQARKTGWLTSPSHAAKALSQILTTRVKLEEEIEGSFVSPSISSLSISFQHESGHGPHFLLNNFQITMSPGHDKDSFFLYQFSPGISPIAEDKGRKIIQANEYSSTFQAAARPVFELGFKRMNQLEIIGRDIEYSHHVSNSSSINWTYVVKDERYQQLGLYLECANPPGKGILPRATFGPFSKTGSPAKSVSVTVACFYDAKLPREIFSFGRPNICWKNFIHKMDIKLQTAYDVDEPVVLDPLDLPTSNSLGTIERSLNGGGSSPQRPSITASVSRQASAFSNKVLP